MLTPVREAGTALLDLLFPPRCLTCDALAEPFCAACREEIQPVPAAMPLAAGVAAARSVGYHLGPLRKAVLRLKFGRKVALARPLGELLALELALVAEEWQPQALVPVPIHWRRRWDRGFNQAELLAGASAAHSGLPVLAALRRTRPTLPQVGQTAEQRATNLVDAFATDTRHPVDGLRVVLVDDVRTTGATLAGCAAVLRATGAAEVYALTVTYDA